MSDTPQPDYTSRVPRYMFADTLDEQQEQLVSNPQLFEAAVMSNPQTRAMAESNPAIRQMQHIQQIQQMQQIQQIQQMQTIDPCFR